MSDLFQTFGFSSIFTVILLIVNLIQRTLDDHPRIQYLLFVIMVPLFFISFPSTLVFGFIISMYCKIMSKFAVEEEREKQAKIEAINERLLKQAEEERDYLKEKCASIERSYNRLNNSTGSTMPPIDYDDYPVFYSEDDDFSLSDFELR